MITTIPRQLTQEARAEFGDRAGAEGKDAITGAETRDEEGRDARYGSGRSVVTGAVGWAAIASTRSAASIPRVSVSRAA